jgi:hypothetical protein
MQRVQRHIFNPTHPDIVLSVSAFSEIGLAKRIFLLRASMGTMRNGLQELVMISIIIPPPLSL